MATKGSTNLFSQIEVESLDSSSDLPDLLRKCVSLGGATGSARLREWATKELKGYGASDDLPPYRLTASPVYLDGATVGGLIKGQQVPLLMIPDFARKTLQGDIRITHSIAEIADLVRAARRSGEEALRLPPPGSQELVAMINSALKKADQPAWSGFDFPASQVVERLYWMVGVSNFAAIVDNVRTTLVELIAEMRAGMPAGSGLPSHKLAEQAVDIAINGHKHRVVINQVAPGGTAAATTGGVASTGNAEPESKPRRWMWWIVGIATVIAAVGTILGLLLS